VSERKSIGRADSTIGVAPRRKHGRKANPSALEETALLPESGLQSVGAHGVIPHGGLTA
jgi:hypothetical protein